MTNQQTENNGQRELESVHKCQKCGYIVNLDDTDLSVIGTGMITCPKCKWSGPEQIAIAEQEQKNSAR